MGRLPVPRAMFRYATVGIEFIAAFGICLAAGLYADSRGGGGWLWTLVGMVVGFAAGMYRLVRVAREYRRRCQERQDT